MPTSRALHALDQLLTVSDPDSMDWADGGGHELATELLGKLEVAEWQALSSLTAERAALWRQCLASVLRPHRGGVAAQLMLDLASDADDEVAFAALYAVASYCGVNSSAQGAFIDSSIRVPAFIALARSSAPLRLAIERFTSDRSCAPHFVERFRLLAREVHQ